MIKGGRFDLIGHFDKISHNASHYCSGIEDTGWYRALVDEVMDMIIDAGVAVELNTKAWEGHRRMFPSIPHSSTHHVVRDLTFSTVPCSRQYCLF